ncbi:MAG: Rieske 2Fe-2S domain-containing protein [Limisphaerales bacterium]
MTLPRDCTFARSDWLALSPFWYPIAFSHEVKDKPFAAKLLDERLVIYRTAHGAVVVARDLCLHRGAPLSLGSVEGDELVCKYHGFSLRQGRFLHLYSRASRRGHSAKTAFANFSRARMLRPDLDALDG